MLNRPFVPAPTRAGSRALSFPRSLSATPLSQHSREPSRSRRHVILCGRPLPPICTDSRTCLRATGSGRPPGRLLRLVGRLGSHAAEQAHRPHLPGRARTRRRRACSASASSPLETASTRWRCGASEDFFAGSFVPPDNGAAWIPRRSRPAGRIYPKMLRTHSSSCEVPPRKRAPTSRPSPLRRLRSKRAQLADAHPKTTEGGLRGP
jgi:hypothetical protein